MKQLAIYTIDGSIAHPLSHGVGEPKSRWRAITTSKGRLVAALLLICLVIPTTNKITSNQALLDDGADDYLGPDQSLPLQSFIADRNKCQIIYILGVEGSVHHGFTPMLEKLANLQTDPINKNNNNAPYDVTYSSGHLRAALFGLHKETRPLDHATLIKTTFKKICPRDGKKRVIIEDASFPAGAQDDPQSYRIHRQSWWLKAKMEEIAMSDTALNHPTNLYTFYEAYSPYAEIKFIVLHRSYVDTVASHYDFDGTVESHSNVIRGFMLLLRRFLDSHPVDRLSGQKLWTLVCVEQLMGKFHDDNDDEDSTEQLSLAIARQNMISHLIDFLGWNNNDCPKCFNHWKDSKKKHPSPKVFGDNNVAILSEHIKDLIGVWPPVVENALPEQQCSL